MDPMGYEMVANTFDFSKSFCWLRDDDLCMIIH